MTGCPTPEAEAGAVLSIDLGAVADNYRILKERLDRAECAAVVKADGYGLGAAQVAQVLFDAGCRQFFVAHVGEGVRLRQTLDNADIHILNGLLPDAEATYRTHRLIPVLNSLAEIDAWRDNADTRTLPCDLHADTGMLRLGLQPKDVQTLAEQPERLSGLDIRVVLSHLASADDADSPQNSAQLEAFERTRTALPMGRASFANSSGIFLGSDYHFDLARPGVALYGVNPTPDHPNPMRPTIQLKARIAQIRDAQADETVGYGASHTVGGPTRIATLAVGYADGYLRSLSGRGYGYIGDHKIPLVGRVSMDLITFDVTAVPQELCHPGAWVELIGPHRSVDDVATEAGTIGYEILTSLGARYHRVYKNG